jgi:hypothetical protein
VHIPEGPIVIASGDKVIERARRIWIMTGLRSNVAVK